jgi:5-methylcytosine-specific restriction endonuclease McrA
MGRYRTFVRSAMRRAWLKWPPRFECLKAARRPYVGSNVRQKWEFQCAECRGWHMGKNVAVDHIVGWGHFWDLSLAEAWSRLLVGVSQLQVLCKSCHDAKTASE